LCGAPFRDLPSGRDFQGMPRVPGMAGRESKGVGMETSGGEPQALLPLAAKQQADAVNGRRRAMNTAPPSRCRFPTL